MPSVSRVGPERSEPLNVPDFTGNLMEDFHVLQFGWNFLIVATVTKKYNYFMVRIIQNILIN